MLTSKGFGRGLNFGNCFSIVRLSDDMKRTVITT